MYAFGATLLLVYLPGALVFRLPFAERKCRALLPAEERVFWNVMISLAITSVVALGLAALGHYSFNILCLINGALCLLLILVSRLNLSFEKPAPKPTLTALTPLVLIGIAATIIFNVPPSEYVIGGRDPGVYINEGIQIAQRGGLNIRDDVVASVPSQFHDIFYPGPSNPDDNYRNHNIERNSYHDVRFEGFFLMNPHNGTVISQFPHLYPAWIAIGYGINGLSGARQTAGMWALLGVVAVYFAGAWLVGRRAAAAGSLLLALHICQIWYGRYPNAEIVMQALTFTGLLAFFRASTENIRFFAPLSALLFTLCVFAHFTGVLTIGALAATVLLNTLNKKPLPKNFIVPMIGGVLLIVTYFSVFLTPYFLRPLLLVRNSGLLGVSLFATMCLLVAFILRAQNNRLSKLATQWLPWIALGVVWLLCSYSYFFRMPGPTLFTRHLAEHDAGSLRTLTSLYLTPLGLFAALIGFSCVLKKSFWRGLAFTSILLVTSGFFFYKIRIIPEHFWAARRFLPIIMPSVFLLIGTFAFWPSSWRHPRFKKPLVRRSLITFGIATTIFFAYQYGQQTKPLLNHVEYAGLIPQLERLAEELQESDLLLVEERRASDIHILALPLAYIYAENVLVLAHQTPNPSQFSQFLDWAQGHYRRVLFLGSGGTLMQSKLIRALPIKSENFQIPEYEQTSNRLPTAVRAKEFDFSIYELRNEIVEPEDYLLDIGEMDDVYIRNFHAKENHGSLNMSFRWTKTISHASLFGITEQRRILTVWAGSARPEHLGNSIAELHLEGHFVGTINATSQIQAYRFEIPINLARTFGQSTVAPILRIRSNTWNPEATNTGLDGRTLGLMVDRISITE